MNITRLKITNFVQVKTLDIADLTGTTILTGENGVGKTTILNALAFAFGFPVRDARGTQVVNKDLIGPNGDSCEVKLLMEIGDRKLMLVAAVGKDRTVEITDTERKQPAFLAAKGITATYAALYEALGVPWSHIECALSPRAYLLGPDLGQILADLCAGEWSMDDIQDAAGDHFQYISGQFQKKDKTDLEAVGKWAFKTRTEVKKSAAALKTDLASLEDLECPTSRDGKPMTESQIPVVEEALSGLQAQRDALIGDKARAESGVDEQRVELEVAKERVVVALEAATVAKSDADKAYRQAQDTFQSANKALQMVKDAHAKATADHSNAEALHKQRLESGNTCASCGHTLTEEEKIAAIEDAAHECHKAKARLEEIKINEAKSKFDGFEQANTQAREAMHKATAEYDQLVAEANRIEYGLEKLGANRPAKSLDAIVTEIETTEERIAVGCAKLANLKEWVRKSKLADQIAAFEAEIGHLDWAVAAFRDGEFLKGRLSGKVNLFEDACNEKLAPFGYSLSVKVEGKSAQVWLQKGNNTAAPITRCSKAELVLTGYAVATAFGTNSPICIDDMDAMFSKTKSTFMAQLKLRDNTAPLFASGAWTAGAVDLEPVTKYLTNAKVVWVGKE